MLRSIFSSLPFLLCSACIGDIGLAVTTSSWMDDTPQGSSSANASTGAVTTSDDPPSTTDVATSTTVTVTSDDASSTIALTSTDGFSGTEPDLPGSTGVPEPICGDGVVEGSEFCDEGGSASLCDADCTEVLCGDALLNEAAGEACDDGNTTPGDTCSITCFETKIKDIAMGMWHSCALFENGAVRCWGANTNGQLQLGHRKPVPLAMPAPDINTDGVATVKVVSGAWHSCRLSDTGNVYCWGSANSPPGVLEAGPEADMLPRPKMALPMGKAATDIEAGARHTCAILWGEEREVACWGYGIYGQIGSNKLYEANLPTTVVGIQGVDELALGEGHTCVRQGGTVRCWGWNKFGQLGLGHTKSVGGTDVETASQLPMPPPAVDLPGPATQIVAGLKFTCALLDDKKVRCWGLNSSGQLGNGKPFVTIGDDPGEMGAMLTPVDLGEDVEEIAAGSAHVCARLAAGKVKCWGFAGWGALGYGNKENVDQPVEIATLKAVDLPDEVVKIRANKAFTESGYAHGGSTCAIFKNGTMGCWGANDFGQLGYVHTDNIGDDEPAAKAGLVPF